LVTCFLSKYISFIGMKIRPHFLLFVAFLAFTGSVSAQARYTHSHNDYANNTPFYKAFYNGFNSIEADIFLVNGTLLVSHSDKYLEPERTLKGMYLDPVLYALRLDTTRRVCLLIDIKDDHQKTLPALIKALEPLRPYLMSKENPAGRLKILISGNRPLPAAYKNYPSILWFDDDLIHPHSQTEWDRVGQVSLNFEKWSKWKGVGTIPAADMARLKKTVDSVHTNVGKLVRFWGAPDTQECWNTQIDFSADIIGTDHIEQLAGYLGKRSLRQPVTAVIPNKLKK
jgi:alkaline phosphatase